MVKHAVIYIRDNFADWEGAFLTKHFNTHPDWTIHYVSDSDAPTSIGGMQLAKHHVSTTFPPEITVIILIGGKSWEYENDGLYQTLVSHSKKGGQIGAICGGVDYLARNGFLNNCFHTGNAVDNWKQFNQYSNRQQFLLEQSVSDKGITTANGTGYLEFTKQLLQSLDVLPLKEIELDYQLNKLGFITYLKKIGQPF